MTHARPFVETSVATTAADSRRGLLIVDDQPEICRMVALFLGRHGWTVHEAASGAEAEQILRQEGVAVGLALVDMALAGADGSHVARRLRELQPGIGIVMVSGKLGEEMRWVVSAEGYRYLPKPFTLTELTDAVRCAAEEASWPMPA